MPRLGLPRGNDRGRDNRAPRPAPAAQPQYPLPAPETPSSIASEPLAVPTVNDWQQWSSNQPNGGGNMGQKMAGGGRGLGGKNGGYPAGSGGPLTNAPGAMPPGLGQAVVPDQQWSSQGPTQGPISIAQRRRMNADPRIGSDRPRSEWYGPSETGRGPRIPYGDYGLRIDQPYQPIAGQVAEWGANRPAGFDPLMEVGRPDDLDVQVREGWITPQAAGMGGQATIPEGAWERWASQVGMPLEQLQGPNANAYGASPFQQPSSWDMRNWYRPDLGYGNVGGNMGGKLNALGASGQGGGLRTGAQSALQRLIMTMIMPGLLA